MNRLAFASAAACLAYALAAPAAFAQSKASGPAPVAKAAPSTPAPAAPAKWVKPIKGLATVQIIRGPSKPIGPDVVTVIQVKNISTGAIHLLKIDEYWYDRKPKPEVVTGDTQVYRKPINPGDIIEMTMRSPLKPGKVLYTNQHMFSHAGGQIDVKPVKKF
jgi:hypothetical protein